MNTIEVGPTMFFTESQGDMAGPQWTPYIGEIVYAKGLFPVDPENATPLVVHLNPLNPIQRYMISYWESKDAIVEKSATFNIDDFTPAEVSHYLAIRDRSN